MSLNTHGPTMAAIVRTVVAGRFDGTFYYGARNDDTYEIRCDREGRYGLSVITPYEFRSVSHNESALVELVIDAARMAWMAAGGADVCVPFRIGLRSPKRLQIAREVRLG